MSGMVPGTRNPHYIGLRHDHSMIHACLDNDAQQGYRPVEVVEVMTPARARRLAADLIRRADEIDPPKAPEPVRFDLPTVAAEGEEACRARHNRHQCQLPLWHKQLQHYERTGDNITTWLDDATIQALQGPPDDRLWIGP